MPCSRRAAEQCLECQRAAHELARILHVPARIMRPGVAPYQVSGAVMEVNIRNSRWGNSHDSLSRIVSASQKKSISRKMKYAKQRNMHKQTTLPPVPIRMCRGAIGKKGVAKGNLRSHAHAVASNYRTHDVSEVVLRP
ncbi:unnamed protein product [Amoebophrya sp. A25]|nr:unnamed protein product [Amoebophrya sp. A25]|eukprot:GSA25T00019693001.1